MGDQAGRIGWGSTFAAAQDALKGLDLNANGTRGAGDGRIDQAKEVVLSLWGDAGRADMEAVARARGANGQLMSKTADFLISRVRLVKCRDRFVATQMSLPNFPSASA